VMLRPSRFIKNKIIMRLTYFKCGIMNLVLRTQALHSFSDPVISRSSMHIDILWNRKKYQVNLMTVDFPLFFLLQDAFSDFFFTNFSVCIVLYWDFFLFTTASRPALGLTQPPVQWVPGALSPGVKRPVCEADHSLPHSGEVSNAWIYTSTPPIRLYGVVLSGSI
jgi:hypothetical protein